MPAAPFDRIDWSPPWLARCRAHGLRLVERLQAGASVAQALDDEIDANGRPRLQAGPLRFVPQAALPPGVAYETHIAATACVPTRDNLHDFFNGLVWCTEPQLKRRLHELQAEQLARAGGGGATRGAVRDGLTVFDENGALMSGPPELLDALRRRQWQRLFIDLRPAWREVQLRLIGHALLEKLLQPRKPITAHVHVVADIGRAWVGMEAELFAAKPFLPLPVLGVPGWWAGNQAAGFYDDAQVFRPAREQLSSPG
ncbi:DUF3025 domain-containing protein [Eleftheria terrae]|uniref:DUF3025 domain-containing protein n=1 Tax=Eleftheria terrae TaxID=1597781 RepID=UPI00263B2220|nr:DUF3025 domain-containing protein [Eleftheria terrae]WKB52083.1 DUF3025 domain-containing protein [Eleftheria terrae]